ncbi:MAG TPA: DUF58 domain-containing protein [Gemmatimonadaceae bacterium]|nr:DUF58 domain-containing protein [Gemmatimonadaceae bacterium]
MTSVAPATFLDPAMLARISDLALLARTVVEGFMHGMHRSPRKGFSIDFAQHRQYQLGDDLRRIDWKAFARTDKFYIKEYEADTNAGVVFALDASGSMNFGSGSVTKFDYGRFLTASLAWLSQHQGDRVGLITFTDGLAEVIPPSTRHLQLMLHTLGHSHASGAGQLKTSLDRIAHITPRAGIIVLVTDCYEDPELIGRAIAVLRARRHDVIVFHLIDPAERDLPGRDAAIFEDLESGTRIPLRPGELRTKYRGLVDAHRAALADRMTNAGADYVPVETDKPLDAALYAYLDARLAKSRVR